MIEVHISHVLAIHSASTLPDTSVLSSLLVFVVCRQRRLLAVEVLLAAPRAAFFGVACAAPKPYRFLAKSHHHTPKLCSSHNGQVVEILFGNHKTHALYFSAIR